MNSTDNSGHDPIYTARRLLSQGQGLESNPFDESLSAHDEFDDEMSRLTLEQERQEAMQP